jgi:hypothetical protein
MPTPISLSCIDFCYGWLTQRPAARGGRASGELGAEDGPEDGGYREFAAIGQMLAVAMGVMDCDRPMRMGGVVVRLGVQARRLRREAIVGVVLSLRRPLPRIRLGPIGG